jgi:hypothetical protein
MEIKNLIDHNTFKLGKTPCKDELIIPVKLVLMQNKLHLESLRNSKLALLPKVTWKIIEYRKPEQQFKNKNKNKNKDKKMLKKTCNHHNN